MTEKEKLIIEKQNLLNEKGLVVAPVPISPRTYRDEVIDLGFRTTKNEEDIANIIVGTVDVSTTQVKNTNPIITGTNQDEINVNIETRLSNQEAGGDATFATNQKVSDISLVGTDLSLDTTNTIDGKIALEAGTRETNDTTLQSNIDLKASQIDLDTESSTRLTNDNILESTLNTEINRNDNQDLAILNNANNIIELNNLLNIKLLFAFKNTSSPTTLVGTTPVSLALPNSDLDSSFETLDDGVTYTLKPGITLLAGTRIFYNIIHNFTLSNVSATDRGVLNVLNNGVVLVTKSLDIVQNQTSASYILEGYIDILVDTTTVAITTTIQATNGTFNAIYLKGSFMDIFTAGTGKGVVATTTTNINYDGTNALLVGQNQTQIDDTFKTSIDLNTSNIYLNGTNILNETNRATGVETDLQNQVNTKSTIQVVDTLEQMIDPNIYYVLRSEGVAV